MREVDLLDENPLHSTQMRSLAAKLFGITPEELPDPDADTVV